MHLRNSRVLILLLSFVFISIGTGAQSQSPSSAPTDTPAPPSVPAGASTTGAAQAGQPSTGAQPTVPPSGSTQQATPQQAPQSTPAQTPSSQQAPPPETSTPPAQVQTPPGQIQTPPGQEPPSNTDEGGFVFKAEVQEVMLHATVVDDKQRLITNLDKGAFTVYEDGKPQAITSFRHEDVPVAMGIVIDNSGSMREKREKVNKAALNLVKASNPQDQVFVVNFSDEYYLDQDFTGNINKLKEALEKVETRGGTALYDAVVASADHMKRNAKLQKKVLFVVTDGEDNASRESLEQAVRRVSEENGPTVYAIGLLGEEKQRRAKRALQVIAEKTGGMAFLPRTVDEVDEISSAVAHDIRNQYTIGYKPTTPRSVPGYRTIHVDAKAKGYNKLTVRTRSGYYAGQERAASQ
ncbi:MAG TPA: VWA domain-containing protein [Terriglobales bacterium]